MKQLPNVFFAEVKSDKGCWIRFYGPCVNRETAASHICDYLESMGTFRVSEYEQREGQPAFARV